MSPTGKTQVLNLDYNIAGLLCYVPFGFIAAIVFLLTESKESKFVRFHAIQSLLFAGGLIALSTVVSIVGMIIGKIPVIGFIFALLMIPFWLIICFGSLILVVITIVKTYQYQFYKLPIIGNYADKM
ncbi:MAG: DUF4870 domain-containing protein [Acidobacteria bacterium]|nr:DUF4870 domain-containing protein [Acidobacteriota bacterium]